MSNILRMKGIQLFVLPNLLFAAISLLTVDQQLIFVLNSALLALAVGCCVAYHAPVKEMMFSTKPMGGDDWLALGIFCSWGAVIYFRVYSMVWRALGQPDWLSNSDWASYPIYLSACAAVFHLAAPGAIGNKQVPTERWIRIGTWIAAAVFGAILVGYLLDFFHVEMLLDGEMKTFRQ